ncbi:MAG: glycosyltransferase family 4 protein [Oscillospiraceae bacterium]|nr:glycosyltransferase family 4 protein [Oscillospiraceae bacterium]
MKKKKDILFLCQFFYPEYISSAQLPYDTVLALKEAGFRVGALCGYPREYSEGGDIPLRENVNGIEIHRLKYIQTGRAGFLGRIVNYFSFTLMVLLRIFEMAQYRAVVVYSNPPILPWIASWAKVLFGTRLVFVSYDLYPEVATVTGTLGSGNPICRLMNHINKCVFKRADAIVALSSEMRDYIAENRPVDREKIVIIPNWFADKGVQPENRETNRFRDVVQDRFVVSYFGNMGTMQDMQTLLEAIRILKNDEKTFFLFAGHGNKMEKLKKIVEEEGIHNIAIHAFLHGQDFQDALTISDCAFVTLEKGGTGLCVPSKTYSYMMQGLPLLAVMDECDIVRDIESGAGMWVRNGEGEKLAAAIKQLQDDPEMCAQMRSTCRRLYMENYTTEICTNKYVALFRTLL